MSEPSPPAPRSTADREYLGSLVVDEARELLAAGIPLPHLMVLGRMAGELRSLPAAEVKRRVEAAARERFASHRPLVSLLARHLGAVRSDIDVPAFLSHFERLALVSGLLVALGKASQRLASEEDS